MVSRASRTGSRWIANACRHTRPTPHAPPASASARRRRGRGHTQSASIAAKYAIPSSGIGTPSGWLHADARTVAQPVSAQNVATGPK